VCGTILELPAAEPPSPTEAAPGALRVSAAVLMQAGGASADWAVFFFWGGGGNYRLSFCVGARHTVAEVRVNFFWLPQYIALWVSKVERSCPLSWGRGVCYLGDHLLVLSITTRLYSRLQRTNVLQGWIAAITPPRHP
jgi:hypothetical protein